MIEEPTYYKSPNSQRSTGSISRFTANSLFSLSLLCLGKRDKCKTGATSHPKLTHQGRKSGFQISSSLPYCPAKERKPSNCPLHGNRNPIPTPFSLSRETHFIPTMPRSKGLLLPLILLLISSPKPPVLGHQSFHRPDPLQHFKPYHGDFDVRNLHYWAVRFFFFFF